jgi:rubrerythrin
MTNHLSPIAAVTSDLVDFLTSHEDRERETLAGYRSLAETLPTPDLRYIARLILSDEERHHQIFEDLGQTVSAFDDLEARGMPIPPVSGIADATVRERTLERLERCIEQEMRERADLDRLDNVLFPSRSQTLWPELVKVMREDTERHLHLLRFMRARLL